MNQDPHVRRLLIEQERLINLASRSDLIQIDPMEVVPGMPPEKYLITFTCRGIGRINEKEEPVPSTFHQVSMFISREFPRKEPHLLWLTPIWHPNIEHKEPRHVCTNNVQNFYSAKGTDELVLMLGEMVQYKRYHAVWEAPWPVDKEVATWVEKVGEPHGYVGRDKPYDDQPLLREYKIRVGGEGAKPPAETAGAAAAQVKREGITLGAKRAPTGPLNEPQAGSVRKPGIRLGAKRNT